MKKIKVNMIVGSGTGYHTEIAQQFADAICYHPETFTGDELKRMRTAYHAIIIDLLEKIELIYVPEPKKYLVNIDTNTNRNIEIMAINEDDARKKVIEMVNKEGNGRISTINKIKELDV